MNKEENLLEYYVEINWFCDVEHSYKNYYNRVCAESEGKAADLVLREVPGAVNSTHRIVKITTFRKRKGDL